MVPEAGIEPARPYERGILSPEWKSIRPRLLIGFLVRNQARNTAISPNVSAYLEMITDRKMELKCGRFALVRLIGAMPILHNLDSDR